MRVGLKKKKRQNVKTYNQPNLASARDRGQRQRSEGRWVENLRGGFLKINVMNTVSDPVSVYIYIYIIDKKIHIINIEGFKVISI